MKRCEKLSEQMGAAAIVLDVLEDAAFDKRWAFYVELGFEPLRHRSARMQALPGKNQGQG